MSRRAASTASAAARCWSCCASSAASASVAIVLVSHDPLAARYADRVFALRDGQLADYQPGSAPGADDVPLSYRCSQREAGERPASLSRARACTSGAGVLRGNRDRSRRGAAVCLPGCKPEPVELGRAAVPRHHRQGDACSCSRATRRACLRACLAQVRRIQGVRVAAPLLEASADATGPKGSEIG